MLLDTTRDVCTEIKDFPANRLLAMACSRLEKGKCGFCREVCLCQILSLFTLCVLGRVTWCLWPWVSSHTAMRKDASVLTVAGTSSQAFTPSSMCRSSQRPSNELLGCLILGMGIPFPALPDNHLSLQRKRKTPVTGDSKPKRP